MKERAQECAVFRGATYKMDHSDTANSGYCSNRARFEHRISRIDGPIRRRPDDELISVC